MLLLTLSIFSLIVAAVFAIVAWSVVRDERGRSAARVAALSAAALSDDVADVLVTPPDPSGAASSLFERRQSLRGHPLVHVAVGFTMSVALIVFIAMNGSSRHAGAEPTATIQAAGQDTPLE